MNEQSIETTSDAGKANVARSRIRDYAEIFFVTVIVALLLKTFVIEAYRIPSGSMEDTLLIGDFLLVNKFIYGAQSPRYVPFTGIRLPHFRLPAFAAPRQGDVVVFEFPGNRFGERANNAMNYVKRCIATPGDTLEIIDKVVFVNGRRVPFPADAKFAGRHLYPRKYADERIYPRGSKFNEDNYGPITIPKAGATLHLDATSTQIWEDLIKREGHIVAYSSDGSVLIDGSPTTTYRVEKNCYFMMGDNRDNSLDSRFWGFVSDDQIIGKAMMVYWSWDESRTSGFMDRLASVRWQRIATIVR